MSSINPSTFPTTIFLASSGLVVYLFLRRRHYIELQWKRRVTFKKLSPSSDLGQCFGADIGGTLAKLVYFEQIENTEFMRKPRSRSHASAADEMTDFVIKSDSYGGTGIRDTRLTIQSEILGGKLHFIHFATAKMESAIHMILHQGLNQSVHELACTGGGSYKYKTMFRNMANIELHGVDELDCMIKGLNFLLNLLPNEAYSFENVDFTTLEATRVHRPRGNTEEDIFPYMLVSIGSGVSILLVNSPSDYERVSGSSLGGGTFWGLCRLLTKCASYDEALSLASHGNNFQVDMSVGDIYGGSYDRFNLPSTTVASSFGKMVMKEEPRKGVEDADFARSLLIMITQNIGQIAYLNAQLYNTKRIFFVGNFLRRNKISARTLAYAINFWSKGKMEAQFCRHEGYLGALGAFLYNLERHQELYGH